MNTSATAQAWESEALRQSVLAEVSKRTLDYRPGNFIGTKFRV